MVKLLTVITLGAAIMAITAGKAKAPQTVTLEVLSTHAPTTSQEPSEAIVAPDPTIDTPEVSSPLETPLTSPEPPAPTPPEPRRPVAPPSAPQGNAPSSLPTKPGAYLVETGNKNIVDFVIVGASRHNPGQTPVEDDSANNSSSTSIEFRL